MIHHKNKSISGIKRKNQLSGPSQKPHETAAEPIAIIQRGPRAHGPIAKMSTKFMMALFALAAIFVFNEVTARPSTVKPPAAKLSADSSQHKDDRGGCEFGCTGNLPDTTRDHTPPPDICLQSGTVDLCKNCCQSLKKLHIFDEGDEKCFCFDASVLNPKRFSEFCTIPLDEN